MKNILFASSLATLFSITGCASYKMQNPEAPSAELQIMSTTSTAFIAENFRGYSTENCENKKGEGIIVTFNGFAVKTPEKVLRIPANQRLYLIGSYSASGGSPIPGTISVDTCRSMASFIPEENKTYETRIYPSSEKCITEIVEAQSKSAPTTYQLHTFPAACK